MVTARFIILEYFVSYSATLLEGEGLTMVQQPMMMTHLGGVTNIEEVLLAKDFQYRICIVNVYSYCCCFKNYIYGVFLSPLSVT